MKSKPRVLVLDDDLDLLHEVKEHLSDSFDVKDVSRLADARTELEQGKYRVVITDMRLEEGDEGGLLLAREMSQKENRPEVIILTAYPEISNASKCMQADTFGYVEKAKSNAFEVLETLCLKAHKQWHDRQGRIPHTMLEEPIAILFGQVPVSHDFFAEEAEAGCLRNLISHVSRTILAKPDEYVTSATTTNFLAIFKTVDRACEAAFAIQKELLKKTLQSLSTSLRLQSAIHWGNIKRLRTEEKDDIMGPDVLVCVRAGENAASGQIVLTESAFLAMQERQKFTIESLGETQLQSIDKPVSLYTIEETLTKRFLPSWVQEAEAVAQAIAQMGVKLPRDMAAKHDAYAHGKPE